MPESVERPAPVSTTSRPSRSTSGTALRVASVATSALLIGGFPAGRRTIWRGSTGVAGASPRSGLLRLDLAVLRRGRCHEVLEEMLGDVGDLLDGAVEDLLVGCRRLGGAADLAHELQRGVVHLTRGRRRLEVVQGADVPAHGVEPTPRATGLPGSEVRRASGRSAVRQSGRLTSAPVRAFLGLRRWSP